MLGEKKIAFEPIISHIYNLISLTVNFSIKINDFIIEEPQLHSFILEIRKASDRILYFNYA